MNVEAIFAGIGAIVTAAGGVILVVRELRRRERVASMRQIDEMSAELFELRGEYLESRKYSFGLRQMMVDHGLDPPPPPVPRALAPADEPTVRTLRRR